MKIEQKQLRNVLLQHLCNSYVDRGDLIPFLL